MPGPLASPPSPLFPPPKRWRAEDDDDVCAADRLMDGEKADAEATRRAAEQMESFIVGLFGLSGIESKGRISIQAREVQSIERNVVRVEDVED